MLTELYGRARTFCGVAVFAVPGATAVGAQGVNGAIAGTLTDVSAAQVVRMAATNADRRFRFGN